MPLPTLLPLVQWAAIASPTLYAGTNPSPPSLSHPQVYQQQNKTGIPLQYSLTLHILASTTTSPTQAAPPNPKLLARQWLALYQLGPYWVAPLVHAGTLSNLYLAFYSHPSSSSSSSF